MADKKILVFSDIDGTLVDCTREMLDISDRTRYALKEVKKKAYLFLVTGRPKCIVPKSIMDCEPDGFVLNNGAYGELFGKEIFHRSIDKEGVNHFLNYCRAHGDDCMFMKQDHCYVESAQNQNIRDFIVSMSHDPDEILVEADTEYSDFVWLKSMTEEGRQAMEAEFSDLYNLNRQQETTFDCVAKGVSKDSTLRLLLEHIDFPYEKTYCFGDGLNDIGMMKLVDHSFAMGNARNRTKKVATETVEDVLDDGFYHTLVRLGLIDPM
ncbi:MAG: Cof-type HAD-IIB family hydrolase [Erysipelotrichaceae bacterium]|nr:Cof-type HAD-IIB family hydrolase [Erysipelotrichaceae bacterium]MBQ5804995.1 Cof-type HAD-IIB family hydrolase [Erysipelotrichaceae bacterium]